MNFPSSRASRGRTSANENYGIASKDSAKRRLSIGTEITKEPGKAVGGFAKDFVRQAWPRPKPGAYSGPSAGNPGATLYNVYMKQIFKSTLLLGLLTGIFLVVGYSIGGQKGMFIALGLSALTNMGTYWFSDKLVLKMQGAKAVDRAHAPELYSAVEELSSKANIPMPKVYIVESDIPNAFATGRSPSHSAVAASTGILKLLSTDELRGVLAHELGHVKNRDILVSSIAATAAGAISVLAQMAYYGGAIFNSGDSRERSNPIGSLAMLIIAPLAATLIQLSISRSREYLADEHGAGLIGDGDPLARALAKLRDFKAGHNIPATPADQATAHLMFVNMFNGGAFTGLFSTHPDVNDRIARLNKL